MVYWGLGLLFMLLVIVPALLMLLGGGYFLGDALRDALDPTTRRESAESG